MKRHYFWNMYLTTTVSIVLMLFFVGVEVVLMLSLYNFIHSTKENMTITAVLTEGADSTEVARVAKLLDIAPFTKDFRYINKDEALQQHIQNLGEDPVEFLGYNPLSASYEIHLTAENVQIDSIKNIERILTSFPAISKVSYQENLLDILNNNIGKISIILISMALVLLFIAIAMIVNTIRLNIYSKRFLINTMKLVGATPWVIKAPIVKKNVGIGIVAVVIALGLIAILMWYCNQYVGIRFFTLNIQNIAIVVLTVFVFGLLTTFSASCFAVNKYIRTKTNDLYYI